MKTKMRRELDDCIERVKALEEIVWTLKNPPSYSLGQRVTYVEYGGQCFKDIIHENCIYKGEEGLYPVYSGRTRFVRHVYIEMPNGRIEEVQESDLKPE